MKILLTGSNGFLGKVFYNTLSKHNEIFTLSRNHSNFNVNLAEEKFCLDQVFDLVIHAAGKAHSIPTSQIEINEFFKINVNGTINLLNALGNSFLPKQFVFISSVSVYGLSNGYNISENTKLLAEDPYGKSKIEAEKLILDWGHLNNIKCTILRLPLIVGYNPPGNLGAMLKWLKRGLYFNVANGTARKSMVLAEDLAAFTLKAAEKGGIFNLTDGYHPSFSELSNNIAFQLGKGKPMNMPFSLARIIAKLGDLIGNRAPLNTIKLNKITSDLIFDDSKARDAFGWKPTPVLEWYKINTNVQ